MRKFLLILFFVLIPFVCFGADAEIRGQDASGTYRYILVTPDGKIVDDNLPPFTDGSNEVSALLDEDNYLYVNLKKDSTPLAVKTTTNSLASSIAQTITAITNQRSVTIFTNEDDKYVWVKVGDTDAGEDSGIRFLGGLRVDYASGTVISYYASPSCKIAIIQE